MRRIRALSVITFALALIVFSLVEFKLWKNSDTTGPAITMDGHSVTVSVTDEESAVFKGIKAIDEKDGDVSDSLLVEKYSNFLEKGRRNVTIAAFDKDNHVTKVTRELIYSDYRSPVFSLSAPLRFPKNTDTVLTYIGVEDVLDGNLSSNIKISGDSNVQLDETGLYNVVFSVANSAGDVAELPATVEIYDLSEENQKPHIGLSSYIVYTDRGKAIDPWSYVDRVSIGTSEYVRDEAGVLRNVSGGSDAFTSENFVITGQADYNTAGVYEIVYELNVGNRLPGNVRLIVVVE